MLISDSDNKDKVVVFPIKKKKKIQPPLRRFLMLYLAMLGTAWLTMWFSHQSINAYWQQTYHRASPFQLLDEWEVWRAGAVLQESLNKSYQQLNDNFAAQNQRWLASWRGDKNTASAPKAPVFEVEKLVAKPAGKVATAPTPKKPAASQAAAASAVQAASAPVQAAAPAPIILHPGNKVLIAGDSIIQGVAPYLQKKLKSEYQLDSINLSKQSTGLAYPKFFDWPATIEQTLQSDPSVKLLVILVGANDPWDFPDPAKSNGMPYLKFQTPEWEGAYLARVNRIIDAMAKNGGQVIWMAAPYMKKPKLHEQMVYLNSVLARELDGKKANVLWMDTAALLSNGDKTYQDSITDDNGETVRVRSKDGIHFTAQGQQLVAQELAEQIGFQPAAEPQDASAAAASIAAEE